MGCCVAKASSTHIPLSNVPPGEKEETPKVAGSDAKKTPTTVKKKEPKQETSGDSSESKTAKKKGKTVDKLQQKNPNKSKVIPGTGDNKASLRRSDPIPKLKIDSPSFFAAALWGGSQQHFLSVCLDISASLGSDFGKEDLGADLGEVVSSLSSLRCIHCTLLFALLLFIALHEQAEANEVKSSPLLVKVCRLSFV